MALAVGGHELVAGRAWVVAEAGVKPKPSTTAPADGAMDGAAGLELLRKARAACAVELAKKPDERKFGEVLGAYQKVASECREEAVARRAEQARQRLYLTFRE